MIDNIGQNIKKLRTELNLTLKDVSEETGLSIGFLSQFERGLTTIAIDSLDKIAKVLKVDLTYFFDKTQNENNNIVLRSYEREVFQIDYSHIIHYHLTNNLDNKELLPRLIEILPSVAEENVKAYQHEGEEFIYVLEGIVTLILKDQEYQLYPGDSAHYDSTRAHNWANYTNKTVKLLVVNTPTGLKEQI
ncbi:helix-turn-helix domain-containing protein [Vallitalea okinawensis]|uniref:helix-turn-helix domain-containing protein n=1 Tax=Vallitalea okinawensis TaxID=2078660 RepID=UPI000CFD1165|nr:XRE family transcriptional regulator [Vallitalea okinawensis]